MQSESRTHRLVLPASLLLAMFVGVMPVESQPFNPKNSKLNNAPPSMLSETDAATQAQLLKLLRLSPTLTTVVVRDPSLLADPDYVNRNSPELAQFLQAHPEVARNPSFYLFSNLAVGRGRRPDEALERKIWPDLTPPSSEPSPMTIFMDRILVPCLTMFALGGALLWLIRILLENRRWGRIFRLQTEIHTKLIDRFGNNQELLTYMDTEAGKRFLEAAPIPVDFDRDHQRVPGMVSKVLTPLQIGVVLSLLGIGLLSLRSSLVDIAEPLLVFGVVFLMPGLGFIISAGTTWFLAGRLGLMPSNLSDSQHDVSER
jgi:hypothetical protein